MSYSSQVNNITHNEANCSISFKKNNELMDLLTQLFLEHVPSDQFVKKYVLQPTMKVIIDCERYDSGCQIT